MAEGYKEHKVAAFSDMRFQAAAGCFSEKMILNLSFFFLDFIAINMKIDLEQSTDNFQSG